MKHIHLSKKIATTALTALMGIPAAIAQDSTGTAKASGTGNNLLTLLLVIMGLLVFVIWLLGRVLLVLGKQLIEKTKTSKILPLLIAGLLVLTAQSSSAQDAVKTETVKAVSNYGGLSTGTFYLLVSVLATEIIIIFFFTFLIRRFSAELLPQKKVALAKANKVKTWWARLNKKLTRAIPVEKEADVMLDHDYDGIRELDNALPPWWKYGFYITIGVAIVYLLNFHVFGYGKNPTQEYQAEMEQARIKKEIYESNNKDKIDENNVPMADAAGLAKAKEIFTATCFACHGKLGEGGAGPNLTDDYWLHKGSLNDIYQSIKHGYPDKGMQSWSTVYSPKEISFLASYIKTLHGTKPPNPKAPQGDLYVEPSSTPQTGAADSSAIGK
ncbi:c-type cytochrome [Ginsengibacter hankyongi]|uniref:C-type cytochrome n=1 Tax=Ginsengibacter hankyongi TaxID=2607284 RepID=A0A5J5IL77_9BACT|nr:cbb3-type cytochrome c oxidase N-terminal domain-containing protein [Ginsengibacter hankyongi]KAA9041113.1 c-type cytochrome [Ginsengibacter hankyongi]